MANWQSFLPRRLKRNRAGRKASQNRIPSNISSRLLRLEPFEERLLFAIGPQLLGVIPSSGSVITNGQVLHSAPTQITLRFDSPIDPTSLTTAGVAAVQFVRGGDHTLGNGNDLTITPGSYAMGPESDEIVARFAQALPSDVYQITIVGAGSGALKGANGGAFNGGANETWNFTLDLGAQIVSVVPQPVTRAANGKLNPQSVDEIDVYFDTNDPLNVTSAQTPAFYELINTNGTATTQGDTLFNPTTVTYSATTGEAVLMFPSGVLENAGSYRLRVGNSDPQSAPVVNVAGSGAPGSSFGTSDNLGSLFNSAQGTQTAAVSGNIGGSPLQVTFPGGNNEPGARPTGPNDPENPLLGSADTSGIIPVFDYNFQAIYGTVNGQTVFNAITPTQEQRIREVFSYYAHYLGVEFVETADQGFTIVTGDVRAVDPHAPPGGVGGIAGGGEAVMNSAVNWGDSGPGGAYFDTAMHEIGHLLGLGHDTQAPPGTVMTGGGESTATATSTPAEPVFPGDLDILYGQYLHPPSANDINLYQFTLNTSGQLNLETFAQRLGQLDSSKQPSQLNTVITLYDSNGNIIARDDDYYGTDSFVGMQLSGGTYYVAITSTGNTNFNPSEINTGAGGTTEGAYQLRLTFTPTDTTGIKNATGTLIDGDGDGSPGGTYNFWFNTSSNQIFVDKFAATLTGLTGALGSISNPYTNLANALAAAKQLLGQDAPIVRIEGNGGADHNLATLGDNLAYDVGFDALGNALADGTTFQVPKGTTVMIDAGAIIKMHATNITVGSIAQGLDKSGGSLQILGTPNNSVYITSFFDSTKGTDSAGAKQPVANGDFGGIVFEADAGNEAQGIFLNYVNHASISYGGGQVSVFSTLGVYAPIFLVSSRPTISYNTITNSAGSAMSADPNSFQESEFDGVTYQNDYSRVGPNLHGNTLTNNSINGMFLRVLLPDGKTLVPLTVSARFQSTDIVYVIASDLEIQGSPGGMDDTSGVLQPRINARLAIDPGVVVKLNGGVIATQIGGQFIAEGTAAKPVIFTSVFDDTYGAGGSFDTTNDGSTSSPTEGDWAGLYFGPLSTASIDHAVITYGGGTATVQGGFDKYNAIEIYQAQVRVANSDIEHNAAGGAATNRSGRQTSAPAVIFVMGAQPVILNNIIANNDMLGNATAVAPSNVAAININVNSLNSTYVNDWGRSTGPINLQGDFQTNQGPLIHGNLITNNPINGMIVRGAIVTTDIVFDDSDIVHVVLDQISTLNQQSLSGTIRLESSLTQSLVVKFLGPNAGIDASGELLDNPGRVGGSVQILGQPNHDVVLTSLYDKSVGAGLTPAGQPDSDTYNIGNLPNTPVNTPLPTNLNAGAVILSGAPLDAQGFVTTTQENVDGWFNIQQLVSYIYTNSPIANPDHLSVPPKTAKILVAGVLRRTTDPEAAEPTVPPLVVYSNAAYDAISYVCTKLGIGFDLLNQDTLQPKLSDYAMIYVPSDALDVSTVDFNFDGDVKNLNADLGGLYGDSVLNYVNNEGGGLLALSEDKSANPYAFLSGNAAGSVVPISPILIQHTGGNVTSITNNLPVNSTAAPGSPVFDQLGNWNFGEGAMELGYPWLNDFYNPPGIDNFQPWLVDPANGQYAMIGRPAGPGPGLQGRQSTPLPADWTGVTIDSLANDTNLSTVDETEQTFSSKGDTNNTPSTAQNLGQLAPNINSGDDNLRLGFDVHGAISQTATSPGGGDVDVYSFQATAGTNVWLDVTQSGSSLDSVVELVDGNGSPLAADDNSINSSTLTHLSFINAQPLQGGINGSGRDFSSPNFFSTNPYDPAMQVLLPGTPGTVNTYFVRVRASSPDLTNLTGGLTKGAYDLQIRLQNEYQYPGSVVQYADIRYAVNGVQVIGKADQSPLMGTTSPSFVLQNGNTTSTTSGSSPSSLVVQDLGNLLSTSVNGISAAGNLASATSVNVYKFELNYNLVQSIGSLSDGLKTFAATFQINYADGLSRPDTTISIFDSLGNLLLVGRGSDLLDAQPQPGAGADNSNLTHGSFGPNDPTIGPVQLPAGSPIPAGSATLPTTYYVAVSSSATLPEALDGTFDAGTNTANSYFGYVRLEPVDSIARVVEDHVQGVPNDITTANAPTTSLSLTPTPYSLGDVVLFINTPNGLQAVDPFTGAKEYVVSNNILASSGLPGGTSIDDIAMRSDGRLFTLTQGAGGINSQTQTTGLYVQLSTADGSLVTFPGSTLLPNGINGGNAGVNTFSNPTLDTNTNLITWGTATGPGVQYDAFTFQQLPGSDPNSAKAPRALYAIGHRDAGGGVSETTNLLFSLDPNTGALSPNLDTPASGQKVPGNQYSTVPVKGGNGSGTDIIPLGTLTTGNHLFAVAATSANAANDIQDGAQLTIGTGVFIFQLGYVLNLANVNPATLDTTQTFTVNGVPFTLGVDLPFSKSESFAQLGADMQTAINNKLSGQGVTASFSNHRLSIQGTDPNKLNDFSTLFGAQNVTPPATIQPGEFAIPINAGDSAAQVGTAIATAINSAHLKNPDGTSISAAPNLSNSAQVTINGTLTIVPGPGAQVFTDGFNGGQAKLTGVATIGSNMYAVSEAGAVYSISGFAPNAQGQPEQDSAVDSLLAMHPGINFTGLSAGPADVDGGAYANTLFATDSSGKLYALDTKGNFAPIFLNGATSVTTGIGGAQGLAFSTLDFNLWHDSPTDVNATNPANITAGHGILRSFDHNSTRDPAFPGNDPKNFAGGQNYYFGLDAPQTGANAGLNQLDYAYANGNPTAFGTYATPGGAYGSLTSSAFSLGSYTTGDAPTLYFNYAMGTDNQNSMFNQNIARDTMRVFASSDGVNWTELATSNLAIDNSNSDFNPELPKAVTASGGQYLNQPSQQIVQPLFDNAGIPAAGTTTVGWRQARVDLSDFAGASNVQLRFDFSTAGTMGSGQLLVGTGATLGALPGNQLSDGSQFVINGPVSGVTQDTTFTFRSGFTLTAPNGGGSAVINDETFTVAGTTYELNRNSLPIGDTNTLVLVNNSMTPDDVANAIFGVLQAHKPVGVNVFLSGANVQIQGASTVALSFSHSLSLSGSAVPTTLAPTDVVINEGMTATQVATAMAKAMDLTFAGQLSPLAKTFTTSVQNGSNLQLFGNTIVDSGPLPSFSGTLTGDEFGNLGNVPNAGTPLLNRDRTQDPVPQMGVRIDDLIVGLAGRGEMITGSVINSLTGLPTPDATFFNVPQIPNGPAQVLAGPYQLDIRRATAYGVDLGIPTHDLFLFQTFDVNYRFTQAIGLTAVPAEQLFNHETFQIYDGITTLTFEFVDFTLIPPSGVLPSGNVPVGLHSGDSANVVASEIANAINLAVSTKGFKVRAGTRIGADGNTDAPQVDLFNAVDANPGPLGQTVYNGIGDTRARVLQGETLIEDSIIAVSQFVGIYVEPTVGQIIDPQGLDPKELFSTVNLFPAAYQVGIPGYTQAVANLPSLDSQDLVPGVTIINDLIIHSGRTGVYIGGSPNTAKSYSQEGFNFTGNEDATNAVPFARVLNNTIFGGIVGVAAVDNGGPTIINNIITNMNDPLPAGSSYKGAAVWVDGSSPTTIVGTNVYQNDDNSVFNQGGVIDSQSITLQPTDPLFVNSAKNNFYLKEGSRAIDSSVNSLDERPTLASVYAALGIAPSPIEAPNTDLFGQLRVDDPNVASPPGFGSNVFKDRGAIERADFTGPTASLTNPVDNDAAGKDHNPSVNQVLLVGQQLQNFTIQLFDGIGVGVDSSTVDVSKFVIQQTVNNVTKTLTPGVDYSLAYDPNSGLAQLIPAQGVWSFGSYTITLNNSSNPIADLAGNNLQQNNVSGTTQFTIQMVSSIVSPWQNPRNQFDVNNDGNVTVLDALIVINSLLAGQGGQLPAITAPPQFYLDVSGDDRLSALDALQVINFLNSQSQTHAITAGMTATPSAMAAATPSADLVTSTDTNAVTTGLVMGQSAVPATAMAAAPAAAGAPTATGSSTVTSAASVQTAASTTPRSASATFAADDDWTASDADLDGIFDDLAGDLGNRRNVMI